MSVPLLSLRQVCAAYGRVEALRSVSLDIHAGEIVTLIGANGAGKSTLLMAICGRPAPRSGNVAFAGEDITALPTHAIVRRGIAVAPEGRRIFPRMTVLENLRLGAIVADPAGFNRDAERMFALFPRLAERQAQSAGTMSGGEQQMLAIARALMSRPKLLLLDEPSLGLAPLVIRQIFAAIGDINRQEGLAVLLVEQNAHQALRLAHRGYVLRTGRIVVSGTGTELLANPQVRAAYLEGGAQAA